MPKIYGDIIPSLSGQSSLGINQTANDIFADNDTASPFGRIYALSGIYPDPTLGTFGVLRFDKDAGGFTISEDDGVTFSRLASAATVVTSVGQLGGTDLTGDIDLATQASGFMSITDTGGASPLIFAVDNLGLSGLWLFPPQGFNSSVVNELYTNQAFGHTNPEGPVQGSVNLNSGSGINIDLDGQNINISISGVDLLRTPLCYEEEWSGNVFTRTVTHNMGTNKVIVQVYDNASPPVMILPDEIEATNTNQVTITFNSGFTDGHVVIMGCRD